MIMTLQRPCSRNYCHLSISSIFFFSPSKPSNFLTTFLVSFSSVQPKDFDAFKTKPLAPCPQFHSNASHRQKTSTRYHTMCGDILTALSHEKWNPHKVCLNKFRQYDAFICFYGMQSKLSGRGNALSAQHILSTISRINMGFSIGLANELL